MRPEAQLCLGRARANVEELEENAASKLNTNFYSYAEEIGY